MAHFRFKSCEEVVLFSSFSPLWALGPRQARNGERKRRDGVQPGSVPELCVHTRPRQITSTRADNRAALRRFELGPSCVSIPGGWGWGGVIYMFFFSGAVFHREHKHLHKNEHKCPPVTHARCGKCLELDCFPSVDGVTRLKIRQFYHLLQIQQVGILQRPVSPFHNRGNKIPQGFKVFGGSI